MMLSTVALMNAGTPPQQLSARKGSREGNLPRRKYSWIARLSIRGAAAGAGGVVPSLFAEILLRLSMVTSAIARVILAGTMSAGSGSDRWMVQNVLLLVVQTMPITARLASYLVLMMSAAHQQILRAVPGGLPVTQ